MCPCCRCGQQRSLILRKKWDLLFFKHRILFYSNLQCIMILNFTVIWLLLGTLYTQTSSMYHMNTCIALDQLFCSCNNQKMYCPVMSFFLVVQLGIHKFRSFWRPSKFFESLMWAIVHVSTLNLIFLLPSPSIWTACGLKCRSWRRIAGRNVTSWGHTLPSTVCCVRLCSTTCPLSPRQPTLTMLSTPCHTSSFACLITLMLLRCVLGKAV